MDRIYCVEDDENIRELIVYALENAGFEAEGFESGQGLFESLNKRPPALIILDIMLPGDDGLEILRRIRKEEEFKHLPVIMLTAKSSEFDKVKGLDMGADDYISKPFGVMELISRVRAVLRRSEASSESDIITFGNISLDYKKRRVMSKDQIIDLTYKEFELLYFLLKNKDMVVTRELLIDQVWGFDFEGETRTVDVHISTLRQKLGPDAKFIKTVRNLGYKVGRD